MNVSFVRSRKIEVGKEPKNVYLEVVDDEGETLGAFSETDSRNYHEISSVKVLCSNPEKGERELTILRETGFLEPLQGRVGNELELVTSLEDTSPGGLNENVVRGEDVDLVDTLRLEFGSARDAASWRVNSHQFRSLRLDELGSAYKGGMWFSEQVGVKEPGTATITTCHVLRIRISAQRERSTISSRKILHLLALQTTGESSAFGRRQPKRGRKKTTDLPRVGLDGRGTSANRGVIEFGTVFDGSEFA